MGWARLGYKHVRDVAAIVIYKHTCNVATIVMYIVLHKPLPVVQVEGDRAIEGESQYSVAGYVMEKHDFITQA